MDAHRSNLEVRLHHFRDRNGAEVDLVAEAPDGRVVCVEIKASASFSARDLRTLARLRDGVGDRFVHGFLLHAGARAIPAGERLTALPIAALWAG